MDMITKLYTHCAELTKIEDFELDCVMSNFKYIYGV